MRVTVWSIQPSFTIMKLQSEKPWRQRLKKVKSSEKICSLLAKYVRRVSPSGVFTLIHYILSGNCRDSLFRRCRSCSFWEENDNWQYYWPIRTWRAFGILLRPFSGNNSTKVKHQINIMQEKHRQLCFQLPNVEILSVDKNFAKRDIERIIMICVKLWVCFLLVMEYSTPSGRCVTSN